MLDNVENWKEWGLGAVLRGTGEGQAQVIRDRPPVNFEGQQAVAAMIEQAHNQAMWPPQRSGSFEASLASGKAVQAVTGSFNAELAWAQTDMEHMLRRTNQMLAAMDEEFCAGSKKIDGIEDGKAFVETYDPTKLFRGDYRNKVTYGDAIGLDEQNRITKLAMVRNLEGMSLRTFIEKAGVVEDALHEEREMAIENLTRLFYDVILPQQVQAGDTMALKQFVDKIDGDRETVRSAVMDTIREMMGVAGPIPAAGGTPPTSPDALLMERSLAQGGIPGSAAGLPAPNALRAALPEQAARAAAEILPQG